MKTTKYSSKKRRHILYVDPAYTVREEQPITPLSKIDIAKRQLATAIRLHFNGGDAVSVHTLAHAAVEVAAAICRHCGQKSFLNEQQRIQSLGGLPIGQIRRVFRRSRDFFNHADRDPGEVLGGFDEADNDYILLLACIDLAKLEAADTDEILAYFAWYTLVFARGTWNLISKIAPNWIKRIETPRDEQLASGARLLASFETTPEVRTTMTRLVTAITTLSGESDGGEPANV